MTAACVRISGGDDQSRSNNEQMLSGDGCQVRGVVWWHVKVAMCVSIIACI